MPKGEISEVALSALRRRRALVERVLDAAGQLDEPDRALLHAVLGRGISTSELARAAGQCPRKLRRRVHGLVTHLAEPLVQHVLRQREFWPEERRRVAELIVLRRRTQKQVAEQIGRSVHVVRRHLHEIRVLHEISRQRVPGVG